MRDQFNTVAIIDLDRKYLINSISHRLCPELSTAEGILHGLTNNTGLVLFAEPADLQKKEMGQNAALLVTEIPRSTHEWDQHEYNIKRIARDRNVPFIAANPRHMGFTIYNPKNSPQISSALAAQGHRCAVDQSKNELHIYDVQRVKNMEVLRTIVSGLGVQEIVQMSPKETPPAPREFGALHGVSVVATTLRSPKR